MFHLPQFEKRRHPRVSTIIMADLYLKELHHQVAIGRGCITDLSVSGMHVETRDPIAMEGEFFIRFYLPNGMGFEDIKGEIMRRQKETLTNVYGIKFTRISLKDRLRVWWYIVSR